MTNVARAVLKVLGSGQRGALATVVRASGSTPQQPGARLLLMPDGSTIGTVGGGAIEQRVLATLAECRIDGKPRLVAWDLGFDLGMCCGGRMECFIEPIEAPPRLIVFGAGHVAKPTAALAKTVGFSVTVVDDREELNTGERFPGCERIIAEPAESVDQVRPSEHDFLLIVTHDHRLDEETLDLFARRPHRYLGLIGSRRKVFRILERIHARNGLPPLERIYAPVGLDLGAVGPEEIAVSIVSELVALRRGRGGLNLRAVDDPRLAKVLAGTLSTDALALLPAGEDCEGAE
jgi:xanthine dehydrogenase accessory factor